METISLDCSEATSAESLSTFYQRLKTHLFEKSFFWFLSSLSLSSGPSRSLYYLGRYENPGLIDWLIEVCELHTCV